MTVFYTVVVIAFGLLIGSFFNVLIYRLPRGESIVWPGSRCPVCSRAIGPLENIPVLSYLFIRGKCVGCKVSIPLRYPIVEALTAVCAVLVWHFHVAPALPASPAQAAVLVVQSLSLLLLIPILFIDLVHYIIPDGITLGGLVTAILVSFLPGSITPLEMVIGALTGGGTLLAIGYLGKIIFRKEETMGGGDIKLMAFLGAAWGWKVAFLGIIFGSFIGAFAGVAMIVVKRLREDHLIPFGPFLGIGAWAAALAGEEILRLYFSLLDAVLPY